MRILIISQYFWPENFRVNELAEYLKKKNHKITVLTGVPNYPKGKIYKEYKINHKKFKRYKSIEIIRAPIIPRGSNYFTLCCLNAECIENLTHTLVVRALYRLSQPIPHGIMFLNLDT